MLNSVATDLKGIAIDSVFYRFRVVTWKDLDPGLPGIGLTLFTFIPRSIPINSFLSKLRSEASLFCPSNWPLGLISKF
jgi:hypothetical protein